MSELDSGARIEWLPNSYRPLRLRRLAIYRSGALLVLVAIVGFFLALGSVGNHLSSTESGGVVVGLFLLILLLSGFMVLGFPKYVSERGFTSPLRVGTSGEGIHVEYDPSATRSLKRIDWAATFLPWNRISKIDKWTGAWGVPNGVTITSPSSSDYEWRIAQISPEIINSIFSAWESRVRLSASDGNNATPLA